MSRGVSKKWAKNSKRIAKFLYTGGPVSLKRAKNEQKISKKGAENEQKRNKKEQKRSKKEQKRSKEEQENEQKMSKK